MQRKVFVDEAVRRRARETSARVTMLTAADARDPKLNLLTPQERECLRLVAQQRSSKEIAAELGISKASVDTYCNRARAKLGVANRREAAQLVLSREPVQVAPPPEAAAHPPLRGEPAMATVSLLPPIASLGPLTRLALIMGGAIVLALAFGMLVTGLQSLNDVVRSAGAADTAAASSTAGSH
jgi:DNA-binding CsgD family transcriptional regulator